MLHGIEGIGGKMALNNKDVGWRFYKGYNALINKTIRINTEIK